GETRAPEIETAEVELGQRLACEVGRPVGASCRQRGANLVNGEIGAARRNCREKDEKEADAEKSAHEEPPSDAQHSAPRGRPSSGLCPGSGSCAGEVGGAKAHEPPCPGADQAMEAAVRREAG